MPFWQRQVSGCNNNNYQNYDNVWQQSEEQQLFDQTEQQMLEMTMGSSSSLLMNEVEREIEQSQWQSEKMMENEQEQMWSQLTPAEHQYEQDESFSWEQPSFSGNYSQEAKLET